LGIADRDYMAERGKEAEVISLREERMALHTPICLSVCSWLVLLYGISGLVCYRISQTSIPATMQGYWWVAIILLTVIGGAVATYAKKMGFFSLVAAVVLASTVSGMLMPVIFSPLALVQGGVPIWALLWCVAGFLAGGVVIGHFSPYPPTNLKVLLALAIVAIFSIALLGNILSVHVGIGRLELLGAYTALVLSVRYWAKVSEPVEHYLQTPFDPGERPHRNALLIATQLSANPLISVTAALWRLWSPPKRD
jgi:hypothetical protein